MFAKSQPQRFLDAVSQALEERGGNSRRSGVRRAAVAAGSLAALTAVSARISSLRRRENATDSS